MATRRGDTLIFPKPPVIAAHACVGGKKEGESPLAQSSMSCTVTTASGRPAGRPLKRSCNCRRRGSA